MVDRVKTTVIALAFAGFAGPAFAIDCGGNTARTSEKPIAIHKTEDGTTTMLVRSTGAVTITRPAERVRTQWQHCVGLLVMKEDKSYSGHGSCYSVDADGDTETISWEGQNGTGTWTQTGGTGKHADDKDSGTWKSGRPLTGGFSVGSWQGTCSH